MIIQIFCTILRRILKSKFFSPNVPILSEESLIEWKERKTWNSYWLIDPLDGTKECIKKNGEFTVNIALIKNNSPIFGIIYAPAKSLEIKNIVGIQKIKNQSFGICSILK